MTELEALAAIREPFPPDKIGKLPRKTCRECTNRQACGRHKIDRCADCGAWISTAHIHLDYVGHAELTDRLLELDPEWNWCPMAFGDDGLPAIARRGQVWEMWVWFTFGGVTRPGVGTCPGEKDEAAKELIGDALRNAAMRFGAALDLWAKSDLHDRKVMNEPANIPDPVELLTKQQARQLGDVFAQVEDDDTRNRMKRMFVEEWGRPDHLPASSFDAAYASAMDLIEVATEDGDNT